MQSLCFITALIPQSAPVTPCKFFVPSCHPVLLEWAPDHAVADAPPRRVERSRRRQACSSRGGTLSKEGPPESCTIRLSAFGFLKALVRSVKVQGAFHVRVPQRSHSAPRVAPRRRPSLGLRIEQATQRAWPHENLFSHTTLHLLVLHSSAWHAGISRALPKRNSEQPQHPNVSKVASHTRALCFTQGPESLGTSW